MDQRIEFLKRNPFFRDFQEADLTEILKASSWNKYEFNEMILHQYELAEKNERILFIIIMGKIVVMKEGKPLAELKEGDYFGEVSFLKGQPRVADVVSKAKQVIILGVDKNKFDQINPESHSCFYRRLAEVILDRYLFKKSSDAEKKAPRPNAAEGKSPF
ncbi:MAG: cyclic nucleotide-binding domain-containing protein [Nitrospinae bacterium]|nr:cyclic nucleotide-binding domain-containing protein [Nitrospinota bacterium]